MEEPVEYNAGKKEEGRIKIIYFSGCNTKPDALLDITKQDAIEKMREGFGTKYRGYFYCEPKHPNISDCLEAALNALLEGKKCK